MAEETKISDPLITNSETPEEEDEAERLARERKEIFKHTMHGHHRDENDLKMLLAYESFDFQITESALLRKEQLSTTFWEQKKRDLHKWLMVAILGLVTGCVAFLLLLLINAWVELRIGIAQDLLLDYGKAYAWLYFTGLSLVYVSISAYATSYHAPTAAGSGIPEVKSILNGVNLRNVLAFKTLLIKFFGVTLAVGGGLCLGIEGPLVQCGSAIAMQINSTSGQHKWDHYKKEYIACGTSAGIAAAFGAPSASVLFVMEEMASFWSTPLLWMVVLCSFCSAALLNILKAAYNGDVDYINNDDTIEFGQLDHSEYQLWEYLSFAWIGVMGGLFGGIFNSINTWISFKRKAYLWGKPKIQILQCLCVAFITNSIFFVIPMAFDECVSNDGYDDDKYPLVRYDCDHGHHNRMANLTFQKLDDACLSLFHYPDDLGLGRTCVFFCLMFIFTVITYGLQIPSGLIDPATFTGAAMGRFFGEFIKMYIDSHIDPGAYAVAGAAAFLGGITRLTLALAVLMLSVVNNQDYFLPMILVVLLAKLVGDVFNISLYDIHIEIKNIPFVETKPHGQLLYLAAVDVMRAPVITFPTIVDVKTVYNTLKNCTHNGFPVVNENGTLVGLVLRHHLLVLIKAKQFVEFPGMILKIEEFAPNRESISMSIEDLRLESDEGLENFHLDLKPYLNESVVSVRPDVPCTAVYSTFRNMSLRHLIVRSEESKVIGMITRKELMTDFNSDLS